MVREKDPRPKKVAEKKRRKARRKVPKPERPTVNNVEGVQYVEKQTAADGGSVTNNVTGGRQEIDVQEAKRGGTIVNDFRMGGDQRIRTQRARSGSHIVNDFSLDSAGLKALMRRAKRGQPVQHIHTMDMTGGGSSTTIFDLGKRK